MQEKLKVVQINTLGATLSTGRTTRELHDYLDEQGIENYIVCPAPLDCDDAFFFSTRNRMRFDTFCTMVSGMEGTHSRIPTKKLISYLDNIRPNIVHLRILHSNYINIKMLLSYLANKNIATVITLHDFWFFTGKCCFYSNLGCDKWINGCNKCKMPQNIKRPFLIERSSDMWKLKQKLLQQIPRLAFVGVSNWVVGEATKSPLCEGKIVKRIYNWIDLNTFAPRAVDDLRNKLGCDGKFVVLGVSAFWDLNDRKGLEHYMHLASVLGDDFRVVLVGKMNYTGELPNNLISVCSIKEKVILSNYYNLADVYLNLSTEETFGKVSAESLACGTPVVAVDSTANKELVPSGGGIVIKDNNVETIVDAINRVRAMDADKCAHVCREFAEANFNMSVNINEYIELYRRLLSQ